MSKHRRTVPAVFAGLFAVLGAGLIVSAVLVFTAGPATPRSFAALPTPAATTRPVAPTTHPAPARTTRPVAVPQPFLPSGLQIPDLRTAAPVEQILSVDGQLVPPEDPSQVGWWAGSRLPGSTTGNTVLVGHVDSAQSGPGALFDLRDVRRGAQVTVTAQGRRVSYVVDSLTYYPKTTGLPGTLFTATGPPHLVIISCGGTFDRTALSYRDNLVAVAHPVS